MDAISQRKLVAAVAVGIVAKQLYDIYSYFFENNSGYSSTTLINWCIIYICFFSKFYIYIWILNWNSQITVEINYYI